MTEKPDQSAKGLSCRQARDAISARIDGECGKAEVTLLDEHMKYCARCSAFADRATDLRERLAAQLADDMDVTALWDRVQTSIESTQEAAQTNQVRTAMPRRTLLKGGMAASLVVAVGGTGLYTAMKTPSPDVIVETVNDYLTFRASGMKLHILDSAQDTVAKWLEARVDFKVGLRSSTPSGFGLVGGRLCSFLGRRLVFLHFAQQQREASLYVMRDDGLELSAPRRHEADGRVILTRRLRGVTSAAWRQSGLIYVLVANFDEDTIVRFASEI